ncbi:hypothetical protein PMIT1342_01868 [Prochlorococcus marinus str. MIT 1342]|uniref:glycosyltransferase family A protein n=1 Tax=Prochlorococcus TaxID=1218 RepID=UPI0007BBFD58|nr:glycosyltransferase family A protein [Prochlorococcus marinus]KZR79923.1 hypothetical protein PMIT1342_01868 [Prochlorococcus marinus str. MIT 1342]
MKKLTIVMPAKNASHYIRNTLQSIALQTCKNEILISMLYAESNDDTLELFKLTCAEFGIDYEILYEGNSYYQSIYDLYQNVKTEYFSVTCFSDAYINQHYLEEAMYIMRNNKNISYVHADLYTKALNGQLVPALQQRLVVKPESGSRFHANIIMLNDGVNELTWVGRTQQMQELQTIGIKSNSLRYNVIGGCFVMYMIMGCTGHYVNRYSAFGRHHHDSRNFQKSIQKDDQKWAYLFEYATKQAELKLKEDSYIWRDAYLQKLDSSNRERFNQEYRSQQDYINMLLSNSWK